MPYNYYMGAILFKCLLVLLFVHQREPSLDLPGQFSFDLQEPGFLEFDVGIHVF